MMITVAEDMAGEAVAAQWIERAAPEHPSLIDETHLVSDLYDMVNVPTAVWIDEEGRIVRPPEPAGAEDSFRAMDRTTYAVPQQAREKLRNTQLAYTDAIRDWVRKGPASRFALSPGEIERKLAPAADSTARATAEFRMGELLHSRGRADLAERHFEAARALRPESWNYRRQSWSLEDPAKAGGPEFWAAVDALGDRPYYPPLELGTRP